MADQTGPYRIITTANADDAAAPLQALEVRATAAGTSLDQMGAKVTTLGSGIKSTGVAAEEGGGGIEQAAESIDHVGRGAERFPHLDVEAAVHGRRVRRRARHRWHRTRVRDAPPRPGRLQAIPEGRRLPAGPGQPTVPTRVIG